ncbi:hypothetical protein XENOCAPTIV_025697, partial [Xenoophorus captivus]
GLLERITARNISGASEKASMWLCIMGGVIWSSMLPGQKLGTDHPWLGRPGLLCIGAENILPSAQVSDTFHAAGVQRRSSPLCPCLSSVGRLLRVSNEQSFLFPCPPGIPLVCFLVLLPLNIPWSQISVTWLGVVHFLACLSPQLGSVVYHLFMNHEGGEPVYHTLLKLDVCGICMINTLGALPIVYITLWCYPFIRTVSLLVYILLSIYGIYCAVTARSSVRRLRSFAWQALFRLSFFLLRWVGMGGGSPTSLRHFLMMDALAVLGGVINITRIPERFRPGLFDYWCNSHQIMHVLVVGSILYLHWGVLDDLLWINSYNCPSN